MNAQKWAKLIFVLIVVAIGTVGVIYLAGILFFVLSKTNPLGKTSFGTWWLYWSYYKADPAVAKRLLLALLGAAVVVYGVIVVATIAAMREQRKLYGEARFANAGEIGAAGLFDSSGIIIGKFKNRFLMFGGMQFVLLAAPTRSGKGVGIVIPNLLNWSDSVVVLDVKQENFMITSGYRARYGQEIYLFNPFAENGRTHRYNPLGYVSDNPRLRVNEILAIGYSLFPGEGKDAFFDDAARNLFLGLTLYLCETPTLPRTIGELLRQSSGKGKPVKEHIQGFIIARNFREVGDVMLNAVGDSRHAVIDAIKQMRGCSAAEADDLCDEVPVVVVEGVKKADIEHMESLLADAGAECETALRHVPLLVWDGEGHPPLSMECVDALNRFTSTSDNTLSSIMATFNVPLTLWASPIFDAATADNDFDLRDVRKRRMSIYLGIPANKLAEARLILNLFFSQLVNLNTDTLLHATPELKHQCLLLMDEFTAPGRIGIIDKANAYMAGYGLRPLTIIQSPGQLEGDPPRGYGRESARTLVTNHACQILFTPREQRDANEYEAMLGYYTFKATGRSRQLGRSGSSESESDQKRPLMMAQELKQMSQREQIINLENTKPILCEKIMYYADPVFMDRLKEVSPSLQALGRKLPKKEQFERAWGAGELAASVPMLDFDLHEAVVQRRMRDVEPADVAGGIDLRRLALDTSKISAFAGEQKISEAEAESIVNDFFDALGAPEPEEEIGEDDAVSDDELAALDAEAAAELDEEAADEEPDSQATIEPVEAMSETDDETGSDAENVELDALYDDIPDVSDFVPDDDDVGHPDDEELPAPEGSRPLLDLSVLETQNDQT